MTSTPPYRARTPGDLLALVPSLLGFHPEDSLVLLTVGESGEPFHARVDLPEDPVGVDDLAGYLAQVAERHGSTQLAALLYTDDIDDVALCDALAAELGDRLEAVGTELVCAARADGHAWWALARGVPTPATGGTAYDVGTHPWMARAVLDGRPILASRRELAASLVGSDPDVVTRVGDLAERAATRLVRATEHGPGARAGRRQMVAEGHWVQHRIRRFLEDGDWLEEADVARLATALALSKEIRDVAWAEMTRDNALRHVDLWRDLLRRCPRELQASCAGLLGFAAWLSGQGALAWCAVERALAADPDDTLAALLGDTLAGAVPPSSWRPIPARVLTLFAP